MTKSKTSKSSKKSKRKEPELDVKAEMQDEFNEFVEFVSAKRFAKNLRSWLLEFLMYDGSMETLYMQDLVVDLDFLFDLLDKIEKAQGGIEERE
jgi:hypothetical protein